MDNKMKLRTGPKVSVCIASHNMKDLLEETLDNVLRQDYTNMEVIVYDDASTDGTDQCEWVNFNPIIQYFKGEENLGVGGAFTKAIGKSTGEYIVLMCADDKFTNEQVLSDMARIFDLGPRIGYIGRWYYQFVDGFKGPVRAWRTEDPIIQANNPSGLGFRRQAVKGLAFSNKMFIETSYMAKQVIDGGWDPYIIKYDTIAARVHASTSTRKGYWLKRRVSSPVEDWVSLGATGILQDYASFIQIKNGFTMKALFEEIGMFIKLRPLNLLAPGFWFYALVSILTPRFILRPIPLFYRHRIGRLFAKEVKRP